MSRETLILGIIFLCGILLRFILVAGPVNLDLANFERDTAIFRNGQNIYLWQSAYPYTPLFLSLLSWVDSIGKSLSLPFSVSLRVFLSLIDTATILVLVSLAKTLNQRPVKTAILFFLNPITIIISAHHGQFDNIAVLLFLTGFLVYEKNRKAPERLRILALWSIATLGFVVKHSILFPVFVLFANIPKYRWQGILLFLASVGVFLVSFLPYLPDARYHIFWNVFRYNSLVGEYGMSYILYKTCGDCSLRDLVFYDWYSVLRNISLILLAIFAFAIRHPNHLRMSLLATLLFLTITVGAGPQYFVLPVAIGALFPTKWFYLYTAVTSLFLFGHWDELNIAAFQTINYQTVWIVVILWFFAELSLVARPLRRFYQKLAL